MSTGASPISPEVLNFLKVAMGCDICEGQTCSALSVISVHDADVFCVAGYPIPIPSRA